MPKWVTSLFFLLLLVGSFVSGIFVSRKYWSTPEIVRDTLIVETVKEIVDSNAVSSLTNLIGVYKFKVDSLGNLLSYKDTVVVTDTISTNLLPHISDGVLTIPITQRLYYSPNYSLAISGYAPNLDWIKVYERIKTVNLTNTIVPPSNFVYLNAILDFYIPMNSVYSVIPITGVEFGVLKGKFDYSIGAGVMHLDKFNFYIKAGLKYSLFKYNF